MRKSSTLFSRVPLPPPALYKWNFREGRDQAGASVGTALFNSNFKSDWMSIPFGVATELANALRFVRGKLPPQMILQPPLNASTAKDLIEGTLEKSMQEVTKDDDESVTREYDFVVPLPSSQGPSSENNMQVAALVAKTFRAQMLEAVQRVKPMLQKASLTHPSTRRKSDAPRLMHFDSMRVNPESLVAVRGARVLLYDDMVTYGSTSEAGRNLLLLAGARRVDTIFVFTNGPHLQTAVYDFAEGINQQQEQQLVAESPSADNFVLKSDLVVPKLEGDISLWNDTCLTWVTTHYSPFEDF